MSSTYGENIRLTIFGQSHSPAIGMTLEGIPAGETIDMEALGSFMARRAPGKNSFSTPRKEADAPKFLSGILNDTTCGAPIAAIIENTDTHSSDYEEQKKIPRPGHADYTAKIKFKGYEDVAGGGHFSGRLTAPLCIAGGICKQLLEREGIEIITRIYSIKDIYDNGTLEESTANKAFPVVDDAQGEKMIKLIEEAKEEGDSVGGIVECVINNLPTGLGDPMFDGMENRIAGIIFGIPAVKGIEFGRGFDSTKINGSENNDAFCVKSGKICTETNNAGGILGGITNGMPLTFKVAFKPTPSIGKVQQSVNLDETKQTTFTVKGRHDPCIVPRAVPCVEAASAIAVYDALLERRKEIPWGINK